jgi:chromosome partitioning protein
MARGFSVVNQKGGVGKTTTALNLAAALAQRGQRVLLIDCDSQCNATQFLGLAHLTRVPGIYGTFELLLGHEGFAPQRDVAHAGLDLVPATCRVADLEHELLRNFLLGPTRKLSRALAPLQSQYDFIMADCGPTIGLTTVNAISACPEVIVPVETLPASLPGVVQLQQLMEGIRAEVEPRVRLLGVLCTKFEETGRLPREIVSALRGQLGPLVFDTVIHKAQHIASGAAEGRPVVLMDPKSRGAREYTSLTEEVLARGETNHGN